MTATQGLATNFHKEFDPPSQSYPANLTILATFAPATGYHSIIPAWWEIPAEAGNVTPQAVFIYSDDSYFIRSNQTSNVVREVRSDLEVNKDGIALKQIRFEAWNSGDTQDLGLFKFEGEQF